MIQSDNSKIDNILDYLKGKNNRFVEMGMNIAYETSRN